jgi:putative transposase
MKKRYCAEQIVGLLRQADVALGKGEKVPEVCKQLGISEQTYYRWRTKYGGMDPQMARQLQELQKENTRLKRLVADHALDNQICGRPPAQTGKPRGTSEDRRVQLVKTEG